MGFFKSLKPKKHSAVVNAAIEERNRNLDDIYNWQNQTVQPVMPVQKSGKKK